MTKSSTIPGSSAPASLGRWRWLHYLFLAVAANTAIWGLTFAYLKETDPTYTSKWTLTLPAAGSSTRISIPEVGNASSEVKSPYSDRSLDPRAEYEIIAESDAVIKAAADKLNLTPSEFGQPRIKIIDNTTLINLEMAGDTPEIAQQKAFALNEAFNNRLNQLRIEGAEAQEKPTREALEAAQKKLIYAQQRLAEHKARTGLASKIQIDQTSQTIEELKRQRAELRAQRQQTSANLRELSSNLNLSAKQAADAFTLKADSIFQQHLLDYSEASSTLTILNAKYGSNHPAVVREGNRQAEARAAMLNRSQALVGRSLSQPAIDQLNISTGNQGGSAREQLFEQLITIKVQGEGLEASTQELDRQIFQLENQLRTMGQNALTLSVLERDLQIAEAIFSTTLTQLDLSQASLSSSYPQPQVLTPPNQPEQPSSPKKSLAMLGAGGSSLLITLGLLLLWLRPRLLGKRSSTNLTSAPLNTPAPDIAPLLPMTNSSVLKPWEESRHKS
ncbi:MAG: hypothetical protein KME06_15530 [Kastovskya adunca ATA6-11-RM4]|jgi:uncharacterized protein involved in exopolysaccharide biosynthesis|nr:hypothetical protein [Kastovskya adunca ATA6-11-RM4]